MRLTKPAKQSSHTRWYWTGLLILLGLGICIGTIIFFNTPEDVYDYEYRGRSYANSGDLEQALQELNKAVELDPDYTTAWNLLCWYGGLSGRAADFMEACERAVELAPDDGNIRDSRGLARALTGDYEGAIEDFEYFVVWSKKYGQYEDRRPKREAWIVELEAGRNPFDEATLEALRTE
jgi:tetratricopeptide (TPR) repeat protein